SSYDYELNVYMEALFTVGLDQSDIKPLEDILKYLMNLEFHIKEKNNEDVHIRFGFGPKYYSHPYFKKMWSEENQEIYQMWDNIIIYEKELLKFLGSIEVEFYKILTELKKQYKKPNFTDFIKSEASLLHLVSTNNHKFANIKKRGDDAFLFCCQFHTDGTPSMRVNAHTNKLRCYGCGIEGNVIQYIMAVEGLDHYHALALLSAIYKIEFRNNPYNEDSELVKKYTNSYVLSKYKRRLDTGYERARYKRASYKRKTLNNYLAIQNYEREYGLLKRIKKGGYIQHEKDVPNKKLVYEIPDFEQR
ncbi:MAG: hypothetical protein K2L98_00740, partial [Bacilli bacterium]|nr:hypothetical protein [Bacilli bacterium]